MKTLKALLVTSGILSLLLLAGCANTNNSSEKITEQVPTETKSEIFSFTETEHDFGIVKQSADIISYDFNFTYTGEDPITVTAVPTSCACTSATISSNEFNKGDQGTLTVNFDPNLHEEPKGKFFKTVTILTEPKLEKQPEVKIWVEIDLDLGDEAYKLKEDHKD